jgi:multiple sugar transport system permease protein
VTVPRSHPKGRRRREDDERVRPGESGQEGRLVGAKGAGAAILSPWATIFPALVLVGIFTLFPFAFAIYKSTQRDIAFLPGAGGFMGLGNYAEALGDQSFQAAAVTTVLFTVITVPLVIGVGLAAAQLLNVRLRGFGFLRALVLLPWAIPLVAAGIMWRLPLHGNFGALNGLLFKFGFIEGYVAFLSDQRLAFWSVVIAHVWRSFPLPTILILASLQNIPPELHESAAMDGAGGWRRFRYVTLPMLKGPLLVILVFETMLSVATFDLVFVMTGGGPGAATTLFAWYIYIVTFRFANFGLAAALSVIMAVVLLITIVIMLRLVRAEEAM